ncbi:MAG: serine/threonine protein kinase, partial [Myxococcales bacterium]|nr:serine/threonine protein kinase [Myxococcales bacterium]
MLGQIVGNYRLVSLLGKGGMGMVYRAEHVQLGRPAALKMLLPQLSRDPAIVQRFFNEARAASAIDHPGIVEIYDFGTHDDGSAYLVMALLRGETLAQRLARGPVPPVDAANILGQVAGALSAAHAQGIVHRDLKPDNIFLVPHDLMPGGIQVKLLDFGIAKLADEPTSGVRTQTGTMIGTPAYMSPEQCMGLPEVDHRTDLYAVGCILFHLLCGRPPFVSEHGTGMIIAAHLRDPAPDPRTFEPAAPAPLAAIALRLLEKDPAARFQSASELRAALVAAGADAPATWPPPS